MTLSEFNHRFEVNYREVRLRRKGSQGKGKAMRVCVICRFETEQDDCVVSSANTDRTVCLRCFNREIGDRRVLSKPLRQEVTLAMGE